MIITIRKVTRLLLLLRCRVRKPDLWTKRKPRRNLITPANLRPLESRDTNGLITENDPRDQSSSEAIKLQGLKSKNNSKLQIYSDNFKKWFVIRSYLVSLLAFFCTLFISGITFCMGRPFKTPRNQFIDELEVFDSMLYTCFYDIINFRNKKCHWITNCSG